MFIRLVEAWFGKKVKSWERIIYSYEFLWKERNDNWNIMCIHAPNKWFSGEKIHIQCLFTKKERNFLLHWFMPMMLYTYTCQKWERSYVVGEKSFWWEIYHRRPRAIEVFPWNQGNLTVSWCTYCLAEKIMFY